MHATIRRASSAEGKLSETTVGRAVIRQKSNADAFLRVRAHEFQKRNSVRRPALTWNGG